MTAPAEPRGPGVPSWDHTARVVTVDLSQPLPDLPAAGAGEQAGVAVLVSLCQRPIGMLLLDGAVPAAELAEATRMRLGSRARAEAHRHGLDPAELEPGGWVHEHCPVRERRARLAADGPGITVAVPTRNRAASLRRLLDSLAGLHYARHQILVVDNAPSDDSTRTMVESLPYRVDYAVEQVPGASAARNRARREARYPIVAFLDDDEVVDPWWLTAIAEEFDADPELGAVAGMVLPAELETEAQVAFERMGGHTKGRGFERERFERDGRQSPYYPSPGFGAGANVALTVAALDEVGGFDEALGAGVPTKGSEDTLLFSEVLLEGRGVVYSPAAYSWHFHRRSQEELSRQMSEYTLGLGGFYTALVMRRPSRVIGLALTALRLVVSLVLGPFGWRPVAAAPDDPAFDVRVSTLQRLRSVVRGAFIYLRTRRRR